MQAITKIAALTILLAASITTRSASLELDAGMRARPGADAGPTRVSMELYVIDIAEIDDRDQTFKADMSIRLQWHDPRLARPAGSDVISLPLSDIWNPRLRIGNQRDVKTHFPEVARIDWNGLVSYEQRYSGDFTTSADIRRFPFDERTIGIIMVTADHSPSDISLDFTETSIGRAGAFSIPNWTLGDVTAGTGAFEVLGGREFLQFSIEFSGSRRSSYYVWSVIFPLILIVMMSWSVFFIKPMHLAAQLTMSATSMLTLIAYRFAISSVLPPVPYLTKLDVFITGSTVLVFLALAESIVTGTLAENERNAFAENMDRKARIVFPAVFFLFVAYTFISY
jgi:hypothetical protein